LVFLLYNETGEQRYQDAGLNALNWLSKLDLNNRVDRSTPVKQISAMMYFLEAFSAGLPHIISKKYPQIEELARKQITIVMKLASENLCGKGQSGTIEKYDTVRIGAKFGGIPFHIFTLRQIVPEYDLLGVADKELQQIVSELFARDKQLLTELTAFTMFSMAEKLSPGAIYRKSKPLYTVAPTQ
jgi:hypothetical protein